MVEQYTYLPGAFLELEGERMVQLSGGASRPLRCRLRCGDIKAPRQAQATFVVDIAGDYSEQQSGRLAVDPVLVVTDAVLAEYCCLI